MHWFENWSTARKIVALILVTVFFTGLVGYVGYYYTSHLKQSQEEMYGKHLLPVKWLNAARAQSRAAEALTVQLLLADMDKAREQKMLEEAKIRIEDVMKLAQTGWTSFALVPTSEHRFSGTVGRSGAIGPGIHANCHCNHGRGRR